METKPKFWALGLLTGTILSVIYGYCLGKYNPEGIKIGFIFGGVVFPFIQYLSWFLDKIGWRKSTRHCLTVWLFFNANMVAASFVNIGYLTPGLILQMLIFSTLIAVIVLTYNEDVWNRHFMALFICVFTSFGFGWWTYFHTKTDFPFYFAHMKAGKPIDLNDFLFGFLFNSFVPLLLSVAFVGLLLLVVDWKRGLLMRLESPRT